MLRIIGVLILIVGIGSLWLIFTISPIKLDGFYVIPNILLSKKFLAIADAGGSIWLWFNWDLLGKGIPLFLIILGGALASK